MKHASLILYIMTSAFALVWCYHVIAADYEQYLSESACVKKYVALGVERASIATESGTCYLINK